MVNIIIVYLTRLFLVILSTNMTSKGAKETIVSKLGFKSSSSASKAEAELDKVRKENAHLKKKIDELAKRHIKQPDSDRSKLLEVKCYFGYVEHYERVLPNSVSVTWLLTVCLCCVF